jgi:hypothetical protein
MGFITSCSESPRDERIVCAERKVRPMMERQSIGKEQSMATSVLEKLKALDEQRAQLLEGAKTEALANAEKAVADLNALGFHYTLDDGSVTVSRTRRKIVVPGEGLKRQPRDLPCPVCHFKTAPHHDGRMHRMQKTKKPFTVEELMEKHLTKVA